MTSSPGNEITAILAGIREDVEDTVAVYSLDGTGKNSYPVSAAMSRHARSLLAAVEAVLKLAEDWETKGGRLYGFDDRASRTFDECAEGLRAAITAALAGENEGRTDD